MPAVSLPDSAGRRRGGRGYLNRWSSYNGDAEGSGTVKLALYISCFDMSTFLVQTGTVTLLLGPGIQDLFIPQCGLHEQCDRGLESN